MKRIAIVGCPGCGKTTFARKLGAKTKLPVIHLDYYYHQTEYDYYNNKEAWIKRVKKLIAQDKWIMDGNYSSTYDSRFKRADIVIILDYPRRKSMYGVIKRRIQYHNKLRDEMPSDWTEKVDLGFIRYVWNFRKNDRYKITDIISTLQNKEIIIFKKRSDAEAYLVNL